MADTRKILLQNPLWSVTSTYRVVNYIDDILAKLAFNFLGEKVRIEEGLAQILNMVLKEKYCSD